MPPPSTHADPPSKRHRVIVDSASRNLNIWPSPSDYAIPFDEPLADVVSVALMSATISLTAYDIGPSNDAVPFLVDAVERIARLPHGDYAGAPTELAAALESSLKSAYPDAEYRVDYVRRRDAIVVRASVPFELRFDDRTGECAASASNDAETPRICATAFHKGSAARALGFGPRAYASTQGGDEDSSFPHAVSAPFRLDLSGSRKNTVVLVLEGADVNVSSTQVFHRTFAILGPKQTDMTMALPDRGIVKNFNPPVGKLARVRVRLLDVDGAPYDCQGREHRLELLFSCTPKFQFKPNWTVRAD